MCWRLTVWTKVIIFRRRTIWVIKHIKSAFKFIIFFVFSYFFLFNSLFFLQFTGLSFFISLFESFFFCKTTNPIREGAFLQDVGLPYMTLEERKLLFNRSSSKKTTTAVELSQIFNFFLKSLFIDLVAESIITRSIRSQRKMKNKMKKIDKKDEEER